MIRRLATASLAATVALTVLGGVLRGFGSQLGPHEELESARKVAGMVLGPLVLAMAGVAVWRARARRAVLWSALAAVAVVGLQGFLGTRPVPPPEDRPALLAAHLLLTLLLVGLLLQVRGAAAPAPPLPAAADEPARRRVRLVALLALSAATLQVLLGSQVRGQLDLLALGEPELPRGQWLGELGPLADAHRHLGGLLGLLVASTTALAARLRPRVPAIARTAAVALVLCIAQAWIGLLLTWRALPPDAQALHLPLAVILWGALFVLLRRAGRAAPAD